MNIILHFVIAPMLLVKCLCVEFTYAEIFARFSFSVVSVKHIRAINATIVFLICTGSIALGNHTDLASSVGT